jgi:hypothetical protein
MGGGTKTQVITPTPAAQPSNAEAINAYIAGLPQMLQAQLDYAPKEAQQQLEMAQQYAGPLGLALKQAQETLYPTQTGLTEALAKQAMAGMESPTAGISDREKQFALSSINAGLGSNVGSGVGNVYTAKSMGDMYNQRMQQNQNLAAVTAGLGNVANAQSPNYTSQLQQYNPSSVMGYMSNNYGAYTNAQRPFVMQGSRNQLSLGPFGNWGTTGT